MSSAEKIPYADAMEVAKRYFYDLGMLDSTKKVAIVGSLRRKADMIGDIDFQMAGSPTQVRRFFESRGWEAESHGYHRSIFICDHSWWPKINVFYSDRDEWGAALMHNTGPSKYNIRKRYLIKKKGWLLNQYGLYEPGKDGLMATYDRPDSDDPWLRVAGGTEKEIYNAMGWTYCKPEDRK
jgi:DNA polymerase (family 10)